MKSNDDDEKVTNCTDVAVDEQTSYASKRTCNNNYHSQEECDILAKYKGEWDPKQAQMINIILAPLRSFLTVSQSDHNSEIFNTLQSDAEQRSSLEIGRFIDRIIFPMLSKVFHCKDITKEFVQQACGVFDTNAFKVSSEHVNARALFPFSAMMMHDCTPNSAHWFRLILFLDLNVEINISPH